MSRIHRISGLFDPVIFVLVCPAILFWAFALVFAQNLPNEIRGYRVHRAKVTVHGLSDSAKSSGNTETHISIGEPRIVDVSLTGMTFETMPEIGPPERSGKVDFLTFQDFRVNGIPVEIEEYSKPFSFQKGRALSLPESLKVFVGNGGVLQAAWNEFKNSKKEWTITGRVFVFGRFKKMGMEFKRVVPVDINITVKSPLSKNASTHPPRTAFPPNGLSFCGFCDKIKIPD